MGYVFGKKIHAREREVFQHRAGNSAWADSVEDERLAAITRKQ